VTRITRWYDLGKDAHNAGGDREKIATVLFKFRDGK
jgi:hypothetical protein